MFFKIFKESLSTPTKVIIQDFKSLSSGLERIENNISHPSSPVHKGEKGSNENQSIKVRK